MHGFYTEERKLPSGTSLSQDLVQHILSRGAHGAVVVATNTPHELISTTGKQWKALIRLVERERASTLNRTRITELSSQIDWMEDLTFTVKLAESPSDNSVTFTRPSILIAKPPICSTLYLLEPINNEEFYLITSWLPRKAVVVLYGKRST